MRGLRPYRYRPLSVIPHHSEPQRRTCCFSGRHRRSGRDAGQVNASTPPSLDGSMPAGALVYLTAFGSNEIVNGSAREYLSRASLAGKHKEESDRRLLVRSI